MEGREQQAGETSCAAGNATASATRNVSQVNTADHAEPRGTLHALIAYLPLGCLLLSLFAGAALLLCGAVQLLARRVRVSF